jgi:hypothetical protein
MTRQLVLDLLQANNRNEFIDAHKDEWTVGDLEDLVEEGRWGSVRRIVESTNCTFTMSAKFMRLLYHHCTCGCYIEHRFGVSYGNQPHHSSPHEALQAYWANYFLTDPENFQDCEYEFGLLSEGGCYMDILNAFLFKGRVDFSSFKSEDIFAPMLWTNGVEVSIHTWFSRHLTYYLLTKCTLDVLDGVGVRLCLPSNGGKFELTCTDVLGQFCSLLRVRNNDYEHQFLLKRQVVAFIRYLLKRGCKPFRFAHWMLIQVRIQLCNDMPDTKTRRRYLRLYDKLLRQMEKMRELAVFTKAELTIPDELVKRISLYL